MRRMPMAVPMLVVSVKLIAVAVLVPMLAGSEVGMLSPAMVVFMPVVP